MELLEHARINQAAWSVEPVNYVASAERNWASDEITWGIWDVPVVEVDALPDVTDADVVVRAGGLDRLGRETAAPSRPPRVPDELAADCAHRTGERPL